MIDGFEVGHRSADGDGWLTGTTVVLAREGAVGGVDVRGGGPGTRETDLLDPSTLVERVHAVVLTGGSAYGLAAADGVMAGLEERGVGLPVGPGPGEVVPIVPGAVIFDLGRGGTFRHRPDATFGRDALAAATAADTARGSVGAGTGAVCGGLKGGVGWAETTLPSGVRVAALVVVNAAGSAVDSATGRLWADRSGTLATPNADERATLERARRDPAPSLNTTIGVVLTDATLTKAQARKPAAVAHDGLARAIAPVHSMSDGDTIFCLASGRRPLSDDPEPGWAGLVPAFNLLLEAAADVFTAACLDAVLQAEGRGPWRSYAELAPSAVGGEIPATR
ncbi:P1 family peptidase [Microlunatus antarcticus]|uniref:L-aminopeptidase/D-esterase-like protein n=1 Tax=Microlunatus antarcticus TaxID=53388 RepID=A0A7W5P829_9ACTN|nr:P1 family peptidase [Microlunatus antarcticus]MBB3327516.1 L-aminopeptidase/D-esterase-like protein [Microlunatus antarcticus]